MTFSNPALPALPPTLEPVVGALAAGINSQLLYNSGITSEIELRRRAFTALLDGRTVLDLAEGLQLRRVRAMGATRIELSGFTDTMRDRLRAYGLFGEIISWKLRFFVPVDATGPAILAKVLECYPIARIADRAVG